LLFEQKARSDGFAFVAGIDEAGRGALCGPVVAAAVIIDSSMLIPGIDDSKRLTAIQRDTLQLEIKKTAVSIGIGLARAGEIDKVNILQSTKRAMIRASCKLRPQPDFLLIDALNLDDLAIPQLCLIKGDQRSYSIACASIIAKTTRDRIMEIWSRKFPEYGMDKNKGYGTAFHIEALRKFGPCRIHRKTFNKVYNCRTLF